MLDPRPADPTRPAQAPDVDAERAALAANVAALIEAERWPFRTPLEALAARRAAGLVHDEAWFVALAAGAPQ